MNDSSQERFQAEVLAGRFYRHRDGCKIALVFSQVYSENAFFEINPMQAAVKTLF
jgi:hypothetical protein